MDRQRLNETLKADEGMRLTVYADSFGNATVGIGHKVIPADHLAIGATITQAECDAFFALDVNRALAACLHRIPGFVLLPDVAQEVLVNMAFQLGIGGLLSFRHLLDAIQQRHWNAAALAGRQSLWHQQTPARCERLMQRLESLEEVSHGRG